MTLLLLLFKLSLTVQRLEFPKHVILFWEQQNNCTQQQQQQFCISKKQFVVYENNLLHLLNRVLATTFARVCLQLLDYIRVS